MPSLLTVLDLSLETRRLLARRCLAAYGHEVLATDIADKAIANAIKNGISEHDDSVSGQPLGIPDYCMSCTLVTMRLDGITKAHRLKNESK